jgi:hypothetical protein
MLYFYFLNFRKLFCKSTGNDGGEEANF